MDETDDRRPGRPALGDDNKFPASLMIDRECRDMLRAARTRRLSMSGVVRAAVAKLMREIGYPESPDWDALARMVGPAESGEMIAAPAVEDHHESQFR